MIDINILCVGKIKERYFREALEEYYKRLSAFCSLKVIEVKEERLSATRTIDEVIEVRDVLFKNLPNKRMGEQSLRV